MIFPPEIWAQIIDCICDEKEERGEPSHVCKPAWQAVAGASLASHTLRQIILVRWFRTFCPKSSGDVETLKEISTRILFSVQTVHMRPLRARHVPSLRPFSHLHELIFDCDLAEGEYAAPDFGEALERLQLRDLPISRLEVNDLTWPDHPALTLIALHFPALETLHLEQQNIWCGMCNTCGFVTFDTQTDHCIIYEGGEGLPVMYARLLAPLKHLHTVKIECPVFLGDIPFHPFSKTIKWTGECGWCMSNIIDDTDFQAAWVAKKQGPGVDPHSPPPRPPALQKVIWNLKCRVGAIYSLLAQASDVHYTPTDEEDYSEVGTDVVSR